MKNIRFVPGRMMNGSTPLILGTAGRAGHLVTGYFPRTSDGKQRDRARVMQRGIGKPVG
jgi:hypothetical protein